MTTTKTDALISRESALQSVRALSSHSAHCAVRDGKVCDCSFRTRVVDALAALPSHQPATRLSDDVVDDRFMPFESATTTSPESARASAEEVCRFVTKRMLEKSAVNVKDITAIISKYCDTGAAMREKLREILTEAEFVGDAKQPFSTWVAEKCRAALGGE